MSIVMGLVRDNFSMIVTDSRITLLDKSEREYADEFSKLNFLEFGWEAGTGFGPLMSEFNNMLKSNPIQSIDQVKIRYNEAYNIIKETYPNENYKYTRLLYSCTSLENEQINFHVQTLDQFHGERLIRDKNILVTFPPNDTPEMIESEKKYKSLIENCMSIDDVIYYSACYIEEVNSFCKTVSNICDFGFSIARSDNSLMLANIRESSNVIKQAYHNNTLGNHMKIIKSFTQ